MSLSPCTPLPFRCTHYDLSLHFHDSNNSSSSSQQPLPDSPAITYEGKCIMHIEVDATANSGNAVCLSVGDELHGVCFSRESGRITAVRLTMTDSHRDVGAVYGRGGGGTGVNIPCSWKYHRQHRQNDITGGLQRGRKSKKNAGNNSSNRKKNKWNKSKGRSAASTQDGDDGDNDDDDLQFLVIRIEDNVEGHCGGATHTPLLLHLLLDISFVCTVRNNNDSSGSGTPRQWVGVYQCFPRNTPDSGNFIVTHFEPSFARTAFPCVDFCDQRATHQLRITVPLALIHSNASSCNSNSNSRVYAISNAPLQQELFVRSARGAKQFVFAPSHAAMCTYHMAFALGDFMVMQEAHFRSTLAAEEEMPVRLLYPNYDDSTTNDNPRGAPIATPQEIMDVTLQTLNMLEQFFEIPCGMPKLDIVVVPKLPLGGQENWGCIFLNESAHQMHPTAASASTSARRKGQEQRVAFVELLIHELAHMYVGNMTSFPFWIKEGLAQYFEKLIGDTVLGRNHSSTAASAHAALDVGDMKYSHRTRTLQEQLADGSAGDSLAHEFATLFNGAMYTQSFMFIRWRVRQLGAEVFRQNLKQLVSDNMYSYVDEYKFLAAVGAAPEPLR